MKLFFTMTTWSAGLCGWLAACSATDQPGSVPVILIPDEDHGTCSIGYQVNTGGAVLRSGPDETYSEIKTLAAGHVVVGCNEDKGWIGIIDGQDETCGVGITVSNERPYAGSCTSGWIDQRSVTSIYG